MANKPVSNLPQLRQFYTGHNKDGKAIVVAQQDFDWVPVAENQMGFAVPYTTSQPITDMNDDKDLEQHKKTISGTLGLVNPNGSVLRAVDFAPGYACDMHRTQSLDYGIVLEGTIEMVLDSGERHLLKRGDVAIQRGTQHQWRNPSETEWTRVMFVLMDTVPLVVGGEKLGEDLGEHAVVPPSQR
ncbi:hypothetical protein JX266_003593 [Neoarthrinium moseri]|nr:hypothetical protein JX266_003593 [Neoarthrinium moseri]